MELSVIIPVYDEEDNIEPLVAEIRAAAAPLGKSYEIVVVDDGSSDGTFPVLAGLHRTEPHLKVVRLKRNFGQTAAIAAGLAHARGEVVIMMDGDGQNDPADFSALLEKIDAGYDLVCGWRSPRRDPWLSRRLPSVLANGLISWLTRVRLHDYGCTMKALRGEIARGLKLYGEMHRFIPAIAYERGARIAEIKVHHRARQRGKSKYGIGRTLRVVLDLMTVKFLLSYSTRPLQMFGLIGLAGAGAGFLLAVYLSAQKIFYGMPLADRPALLLAVLLLFIGFQFITMGLLGEMLARTYHESQDKAVFVVGDVLDERRAE